MFIPEGNLKWFQGLKSHVAFTTPYGPSGKLSSQATAPVSHCKRHSRIPPMALQTCPKLHPRGTMFEAGRALESQFPCRPLALRWGCYTGCQLVPAYRSCDVCTSRELDWSARLISYRSLTTLPKIDWGPIWISNLAGRSCVTLPSNLSHVSNLNTATSGLQID